MKVIQNVEKTNFSEVAKKYGSLKIGKVVYVYLERHDALIRKDLYYTYKAAGTFENFLAQIGEN
jgi:hypothetical protein